MHWKHSHFIDEQKLNTFPTNQTTFLWGKKLYFKCWLQKTSTSQKSKKRYLIETNGYNKWYSWKLGFSICHWETLNVKRFSKMVFILKQFWSIFFTQYFTFWLFQDFPFLYDCVKVWRNLRNSFKNELLWIEFKRTIYL